MCVYSSCFLTRFDVFLTFWEAFQFSVLNYSSFYLPKYLSTLPYQMSLYFDKICTDINRNRSSPLHTVAYISALKQSLYFLKVLTTQVSDGHGYSTTFISSAVPSKSTLPHVLLSTGIPLASKSAAQVKHLKMVSSNALMSWPLQLF